MPAVMTPVEYPQQRIAHSRARLEAVRQQVRRRVDQGATGAQTAAFIAESFDALVIDLFQESLHQQGDAARELLERNAAVVAVGGSGRGELAPCSDVDLLFLHTGAVGQVFAECVGQLVRDCWDAGLKLGHSIRTIPDALRMARQEPQFATALIEARRLWGSEELVATLGRRFRRRVVRGRAGQFIADCVASRIQEREQHGATVQQLQPDVKRSLGGLRDIHLIRWIGYARFGVRDIDSLRLKGAMTKDEARRLSAAYDFLMQIRIDLHLAAGKPQDVLTRDEQLRIAASRGIEATAAQLPVERFMQEYFRHTTVIAEIAQRFAALYRQHPIRARLVRFVMTHRVDGIYQVGPEYIDIAPRHRAEACSSLERILTLYLCAALYRVRITPELADFVKQSIGQIPSELSPAAAAKFLLLLRQTGELGPTLRGMFDTGVLELVLPPMRHIRCLLQFNQYHSYTVDEHTLRTIEAAEQLESDQGPLGTAYREIREKEVLHLALLLHDAGKGYEEDHCEVGRRLAEETAVRLGLTEHQRDLLVFLVHQHLAMAHLAFRRNISDPEVLLRFNHDVGSPEALRMLYVLTAADLTAVGPGVWNEWKSELLTNLYDCAMLALSGKHYLFQEQARLSRVREEVLNVIASGSSSDLGVLDGDAIRQQLELFPPHYLTNTPPARIVADLERVRQLQPRDVSIEAKYESETGTVEYRVITREQAASGAFHKITGALTAKRMEILSAQISTSQDGIIIDSYRVVDHDHAGEVPDFRIEETAATIRRVLSGEVTVEQLLRNHRRFTVGGASGPVSNLPTRVVIDNETADRYTILDVFAHDRQGLLYTIARTIYNLELSVVLAKISTHFDQVVDVFYVTDRGGEKIHDDRRLTAIRQTLAANINEFEREG